MFVTGNKLCVNVFILCLWLYLEDELLIDDFLADARLKIRRLQEAQEELVDQLNKRGRAEEQEQKYGWMTGEVNEERDNHDKKNIR